ncbi:acyl-CoA reductase-like NAD-dependent aldehyde dehydrogenase [Leucobacter exalbidus]|uniref:Acyl-CoA reductase-like NAD-dependent aldehyde dehydrogenase n=1 Tax=Leucobacter exalbidus TaxID=662960 RepID=A0A940T672_9MICO|nr:aldehyde dehydrogenase family protein [Leucobacter exalbidus]MBP1326701.1 acyl-CoA reductase-like NAD-dependent aldehyde dehydrogenase [Leucobacter exalbidus]
MSTIDTPTLPLLEHIIGGERVAGNTTLPVFDPSTGKEIAAQAVATEQHVDMAVNAASLAFKTWRRTSAAERSELLHKLADAVAAEQENFARLESLDVGKPISAARADMPYHWDTLRYFAGAIRVAHGTSLGEVAPGLHSRVEREPLGVVGLVIPWNAPLLEALWKIAPALAAGNTLVMKVSRVTPLTTTRLFELASEIFPPGVVNLVLGDSLGGKALAAHPRVSLLSLTGSTNTGKQVAATGAGSLKRMHLELGGKAPVLVHPGIDLAKAAAELVATGYVGAGQDCTAACRVIVHEAAYDEFVPHYLAEVDRIRMGAGLDEASTMGPLVSDVQRDSVQGYVDRAKSYATIARGGEGFVGDGYFVQPTVVLDAAQDSEIIQQEVFGPVVSIQRARNEEEMLTWANGTPYGLAASVWTNDLNVSQRATRELDFGTVWVNTHMQVIPDAPFGGFGESGYGKELSMMAIEEYSRYKHVMVQSN